MLTTHGSFATIRWGRLFFSAGPGTIHALRNWKIIFNACLPARQSPKAPLWRTPVRINSIDVPQTFAAETDFMNIALLLRPEFRI